MTIQSCEFVKDGQKDGRMWQLFRVIDTDGKKYTTFNGVYPELVGKTVEAEVTNQASKNVNPKTGKPYMDYLLGEPVQKRPEASFPQSPAMFEEILRLVRDNNRMLKDILDANNPPVDEIG